MDDKLAQLAAAVRETAPKRISEARVADLANNVAARLTGKIVYPEETGRRLPEIRVAPGAGETRPWLVALAVWTATGLDENVGNRVAEQLADSVRLRREFPDGVRLALMIVVVGAATGSPSVDLTQVARLSGDAFDSVVLGLVGERDDWVRVTAHGPEPLAGLPDAIFQLTHELPPAGPAPVAAAEAEPSAAVAPPLRFLLVASEWESANGGLSTFNREFAIALAAAGIEVHIAVPTATDYERDAAANAGKAGGPGIRLAVPVPIPGITGLEILLTRPQFDDPGYRPDVIVGHGRILGPYAYALQKLYYPQAKRLHIVHTDAERLEGAKEDPGGASRMDKADERNRVEVDLAVSADLVAGVGPLLAESIEQRTRRRRARTAPKPVTLLPGLPEGDEVDPADWPRQRQVLLIARAEDVRVKGIDLAVLAVKAATTKLGSRPEERPVLVVRGLPLDHDEAERNRIKSLAEPVVELHFRPRTTSREDLLTDLWESRVVIMPSRHEGFGLAGYEAMAVGVPVLISEESGLARMLTRMIRDGENPHPREILPVVGTEAEVGEKWAEALRRVLANPEESFRRAADLRAQLRERISWSRTIEELLRSLGLEQREP